MGMGNYPCQADTIEIEFVKEMCPDELDDFLVALDDNGVSREDFAQAFEQDDLQDIASCTAEEEKQIMVEWDKLYGTFKKATGGLELGMVYHDADDRGDELDGWKFSVDGVYGYTPAGEKYKDKIIRKSWTVFG